jgi:hypothetical protein
MTNGIKALRKIQLYKEAVSGGSAAATTVWRGTGGIEDTRTTVFPDENTGYISGTDRAYVPVTGSKISLDDTPATFEQLPYLFNSACGSAAGSVSGSGYLYTYNWPTTSTITPQTFTIEAGDNNRMERASYAFVSSLSIAGKSKEAVTMSAELTARGSGSGAFTGSVALPSVEDILFGKGVMYIDDVSGTIGSTQVSSTLLGFSHKYNPGLKEVYTGDGSTDFNFVKQTMQEATLEITFEFNGSASAEIDNFINQVSRQIRLKFAGTVGSYGSYTAKTFILDIVGKWEKFGKLEDQDGNDIVTGTFRGRYNSTANLFGRYIVVNTLASLP